jgi:hypothetical protein
VTGVELIVAALAGGAAAGVTDVTGDAIRDSYTELRESLRRRLASSGNQAAQALDAENTDSGEWQVRLGPDLIESGADRDEPILAAARELLAQVELAGGRSGGYQVDLSQAKGVQLGDNNTQHNTFN